MGVCARLRVPYSTFKDWMRAVPGEDDPDLAEFQSLVISALDQARVADIERAEQALDAAHPAKASATLNIHTFHHEKRFKRFYQGDDEPKASKVELTGKDGGPLETTNVQYVIAVPPDEPEEG